MSKRYARILEFNQKFVHYGLHIRELIGLNLLLIALGGVVIAKVETLSIGDGLYFAAVTGLTIGYGDISPTTTWGRILSLVVGLLGTLFAGLVVAVATRALHDTVQRSAQGDH